VAPLEGAGPALGRSGTGSASRSGGLREGNGAAAIPVGADRQESARVGRGVSGR